MMTGVGARLGGGQRWDPGWGGTWSPRKKLRNETVQGENGACCFSSYICSCI